MSNLDKKRKNKHPNLGCQIQISKENIKKIKLDNLLEEI